MNPFGGCYRGRRVLVTGHTGFKGSWLALWLTDLGAEVTGIALDPDTTPNHFDQLDLELTDERADLTDAAAIADLVRAAAPELVFHLAAQSLVRRSYADPLGTWATNTMGTANLLEACRHAQGVRGIVVVTTDKCYENRETGEAFKETDRLGGSDPYSASKAACEFVAASYRSAFFDATETLVASARAGNVIGGGDWAEDRLVPDLVRAIEAGGALEVRSPKATRPWQHVLECLSGYLMLGRRLLDGDAGAAQAWNFGPGADSNSTVAEVLALFGDGWPEVEWRAQPGDHPAEAHSLRLDSTKARQELGWKPVWSLRTSIEQTSSWYREFLDTGQAPSHRQLEAYSAAAADADLPWAMC